MRRAWAVWIITAFLVGTIPVNAQGLTEKLPRKDNVARLKADDEEMAAAIKHARATLPQFFALARNPKPSMSQFRLKVGLANGDNKEFVWVRPFEKTAEGFTGQLRNDPRSDKRLKFGDLIKFSEQDIADWAYTKDGRMMGNVTTCVVLKRQPKHEADAFKRKYAFECDFDR